MQNKTKKHQKNSVWVLLFSQFETDYFSNFKIGFCSKNWLIKIKYKTYRWWVLLFLQIESNKSFLQISLPNNMH